MLKDVNKKLAVELHAAESALDAQKEETEKLCERLGHLNVRNVNKKIKRSDDKIEKYKSQLEALEHEVYGKSEEIEQFKAQCHSLHQKKKKLELNLIAYKKKPTEILMKFSQNM